MKTPFSISICCCLLLVLFSFQSAAQPTFSLSGSCVNLQNKLPLDNTICIIVHAKYRTYKTYCDLNGKYRFALPDSLNGQKLWIQPLQDNTRVHQERTSEPCSIECTQIPVYLFHAGRRITVNTDSSRNYIIHFGGKVVNNHLYFPVLYFKKNDLEIIRSNFDLLADSAICTAKNILQCNKNWVIEIKGHCSPEENNKELLSLQRANLVKEKLIAKGILPSRITTKGYGDSAIPESTEYMEERDQTAFRIRTPENERQAVTFVVIKKDFAQQKR